MSDNRISPLRKAVLNELAKRGAAESAAPSKRGRPKKSETPTILVTVQEAPAEEVKAEEPVGETVENSAPEETPAEAEENKTDESEVF